jgi:hypothetical protein
MKRELKCHGFSLLQERRLTSRFAQGCQELRAHEDCPQSFYAAFANGLESAWMHSWDAEAFGVDLNHAWNEEFLQWCRSRSAEKTDEDNINEQ